MATMINFSKFTILLVSFIISFNKGCIQSIENKSQIKSGIYLGINRNKQQLIAKDDNVYRIIKDKLNEMDDLIFLLQSDIKIHSRYVLNADQACLELVLTQKELRKNQKTTRKDSIIYKLRIARLKDIINNNGLREKLMSDTIDVIYKRLQDLDRNVTQLQKGIDTSKDIVVR